jgi:hypothetical protein
VVDSEFSVFGGCAIGWAIILAEGVGHLQGLPLLFSQSRGLSKKFGSGNAYIKGGKFKSVPLGEQDDMGVRGANSRATKH